MCQLSKVGRLRVKISSELRNLWRVKTLRRGLSSSAKSYINKITNPDQSENKTFAISRVLLIKMTGFCLMNLEEPICHSHRKKVSCFKTEIPHHFESSGDTDIDCSFIFPSGYSVYVEEFIFLNNDPGPDNFVYLDDEQLQYRSQLKWESRRQLFWRTLEKGHPLRKESVINRRANYQCVKTLKVKTWNYVNIFDIW